MKNIKKKNIWIWTVILIILSIFTIIGINNKMNKNFVIKEETLIYKKLPKSLADYKILQISDLHSKEFGTNNEKLINSIKEINPDLILVTGDMFTVSDISIDMNEEELVPYQLLSKLATNYKIVYVSGNHEEGKDIIYNGDNYRTRDRSKNNAYNRYRSKLESLGVTFVENSYLQNYNDFINIYGVYFDSMEKNEYYQSINLDKTKFNIMLCHDPKYFDTFANMGFDLVLSGHVHGGIIRIPLVGGLFSPDRTFFPKYDKGIYKINNSYMNVSTGLGDSILKRVFNPPQINVIILKNK
ncbi:metallophosphoesterase [Terrisporobacter hibernicus]|uniref:Metallophosphoesterase n=1 Tax=Terrisporobacter hibernicus TaxID=2813371 RepID=A0AAX2ZME2_9FIRM|nr:metallophosphoesterase [Terrisporobacter hibernicus]UEL48697.1 metallophosphoesterase [Terrisporobacter hibernicus]